MNADDALLSEIDKQYRPTLTNLDVSNPKLMILFSGPPSSGKSTIAKALEQYFRALRLENDTIRTILVGLRPHMPLEEKSQIAYDYMSALWGRLIEESPNGLWIIDSSVDRTYETKKAFADAHSFQILLLEMCIPEETHRRWIITGGDRPFSSVEGYLGNMERRREEQAIFLRKHKPDMTITPGYSLRDIFSLVQQKIAKLSD